MYQANLQRMIFISGIQFVYKILDLTVFNRDDLRSAELQMAQNGLPNKSRLCAINGLSPAVMIGNSIIENQVLGDLFDSWQPMKTSYTQSPSDDKGGRPEMDDGEISEVTQTGRDNESNDPDNRANIK